MNYDTKLQSVYIYLKIDKYLIILNKKKYSRNRDKRAYNTHYLQIPRMISLS